MREAFLPPQHYSRLNGLGPRSNTRSNYQLLLPLRKVYRECLRLRKRTPSVVVTACSTAVPTVQRCVGWSTVSAYMNGGLSLNRGSSRALFETEGSKGRMGKKWKVESEVK